MKGPRLSGTLVVNIDVFTLGTRQTRSRRTIPTVSRQEQHAPDNFPKAKLIGPDRAKRLRTSYLRSK
jgi:hypothetical protein